MAVAGTFPRADLEAFDAARSVAIRSGEAHAFTRVWVVVVRDRVYVRSWNDKPSGWYRAFLADPSGTARLGRQEWHVRATPAAGARIRKAVTAALSTKYDSKAEQKWAVGFAEPGREATTLELIPARRQG